MKLLKKDSERNSMCLSIIKFEKSLVIKKNIVKNVQI